MKTSLLLELFDRCTCAPTSYLLAMCAIGESSTANSLTFEVLIKRKKKCHESVTNLFGLIRKSCLEKRKFRTTKQGRPGGFLYNYRKAVKHSIFKAHYGPIKFSISYKLIQHFKKMHSTFLIQNVEIEC